MTEMLIRFSLCVHDWDWLFKIIACSLIGRNLAVKHRQTRNNVDQQTHKTTGEKDHGNLWRCNLTANKPGIINQTGLIPTGRITKDCVTKKKQFPDDAHDQGNQ